MHLTKNADGTFTVNDEPMRLEGDDADRFMAEMEKSDREEPSAEDRRFAEQCDRVYHQNMAKLGR